MALEGLHHITAITADARRNVDFYARTLGLRLVKKTVNFDQPDVYHLYSGDEHGTPASILRDIGFAVDEPAATLGAELKLPPQYEAHRAQLERALTPIGNPRAAA